MHAEGILVETNNTFPKVVAPSEGLHPPDTPLSNTISTVSDHLRSLQTVKTQHERLRRFQDVEGEVNEMKF